MQHNVRYSAARTVAGLAAAAALSFASLADAQTGAQSPAPTAQPLSQAAPPVDPSFSAYSLAQTCKQKNDNVAHGQCVGAIRGIIHGYQYGVLFLGQRASLPANETQRVSLCLRNTPVSSIVDEFVGDAGQVNEESLKHTPAEVAVLGSVHMHHSCN
ncbi:hypothetical protein LMG28727_00195 [Paraburkholderia kirstenboschensis]|uniref:hypothetical protein n=1 Tax=Paraburkholderia kirstenboschensis TaxID=1245436 RepID=UPI000A68A9FF|nr:hypothetical protein [Paraburkholderia kirstenboschensis]CAD6508955.1 hypothetical protein LMG28727_00195 [Paraburkholderia kirstenboschensis]